MFIKVKLTLKPIILVRIKIIYQYSIKVWKNIFNYEDNYKIIYFSNTLTVLVGPRIKFPNTGLKTNHPLRKDLK